MEIYDNPTSAQDIDKEPRFPKLVKDIQENCKKCLSTAPIACLSGCRTWKLKNQFRDLYKIARNPEFMNKLMNTLKSKKRMHLLALLTRRRYSSTSLQQELKTLGSSHSQRTMVEEEISPLIGVGLVYEDQNEYSATLFGRRLFGLAKELEELGDCLPPHSECHEEIALDVLSTGHKTREELERLIPANRLGRILSRLQETKLVEKSPETEHIFFFTTKRDPNREELSPTEKRLHENISINGISARKLAQKTSISLRRTYRHIRRLKGKKLVFVKEKPVSYWLTSKGMQIILLIKRIRSLTAEAVETTAFLAEQKEINERSADEVYSVTSRGRKEETIETKTAEFIRHN